MSAGVPWVKMIPFSPGTIDGPWRRAANMTFTPSLSMLIRSFRSHIVFTYIPAIYKPPYQNGQYQGNIAQQDNDDRIHRSVIGWDVFKIRTDQVKVKHTRIHRTRGRHRICPPQSTP